MRLFSNRSQRTSKCGKNISDTLGCASCATFLFLPHSDVICDLLLNRRTATWNLFVKYIYIYIYIYLTVILRGRAGYELIYITNEAVGRVGYYQLISGKSEKNNCFSKFSSNSLDFFGWNLLKSWHFLYRRRRETIFSDLQNFSTRNSPSVFPYLVKLNDNGSYHGLREPIRKLENHYPELKIY